MAKYGRINELVATESRDSAKRKSSASERKKGKKDRPLFLGVNIAM